MTATSLGLGGQPIIFLGAAVKHVSSSLGMSTNPSTATITLVEDELSGFIFETPVVGTFTSLQIGSTWKFAGVITKFEVDLAQIGGRTIRVNMSDPREIMRSIPLILAPGSETISIVIEDTGCSIIDIYGAYTDISINLSDWNQSGMPFKRIASALKGDNIRFGDTIVPVPQQFGKAFGETYAFILDDVSAIADGDYRVNTNLAPISNMIEDISQKNSFDWFVESERLANGRIEVIIRTIDRSQDSFNLGLQSFLDVHPGRVVSATSGTELRNDLACLVVQGAAVETLQKLTILGMANEPIDLSAENGSNAYTMGEDEMRAVLNGRLSWELWLSTQQQTVKVEGTSKQETDPTTGQVRVFSPVTTIGGFSRYGGDLLDSDVSPIVQISKLNSANLARNVPKDSERGKYLANIENKFVNAGKVYEKLKGHAQATYGKRWAHDDVLDEIIESSWTRGAVAGNDDPNEFFRQQDGKTRAYVEFSSEEAGGAFSLGLSNLRNLFGSVDIFRGITRFGTTFSNVSSAENSILPLELARNFKLEDASYDFDKADSVINDPESSSPSVKTTLWVACTIDKDGVVKIDSPVIEASPDASEIIALAIAGFPSKTDGEKVKKNMEKLACWTGFHLFEMHPKAFQPEFVYIPTRSRTLRYGPIFPDILDENAQGKLQVLQDDGFAPWEYGSISLMAEAMRLKVNNATSLQREVFSASVVVEGFPQFNLGDGIDKNANINSISMSFGDGGVKTTYNLQTFTRKFGQFTKEDWARLALLINGSGPRTLPQQGTNFMEGHRFVVNKNFSSKGIGGQSGPTRGASDFG